jgi:excinuclease ABC subunit A
MKLEHPTGDAIVIRGARQNNLKNLTLALPANELVVVTGVSGSGKSSLVFDTLYAEGQRRYVETFSPYARQFLERMDKPQVDAIEGIPPAIAIDQTNPVRTSRSTVGTMTELNDHLKLLFARAAQLHCRQCGRPVRRDTPQSIYEALAAHPEARLRITFAVPIPKNFSEKEVEELLQRQGYTQLHSRSRSRIEVIHDTVRPGTTEKPRVMDAIEAALRFGQGRLTAYPEKSGSGPNFPTAEKFGPDPIFRFSTALHCAECDIAYSEPTPAAFSFNSPIGACETCRGFGRVIGVDYGLVIPDEQKTLREGAIRPWQTPSFKECQDDLAKYAKKRRIPMDTPWREMRPEHRHWVLEGDTDWVSWKKSWPGSWYGVGRFFKWLESKAYKMHIRVLLSKYRAYTECAACGGARLKPDAMLWKIEGRTIRDLMLLPVQEVQRFFDVLRLPAPMDEATDLLLGEIRTRLGYLGEVGLGYLTLDRQSRTLSGGEVQRINLTTALGTSLVNTLFVLDEPSIGLHPRDMQRVIRVMQKLRDAGNSLVVVEHDPQIMFAADRILDMGPGPGERGGEVVFFGAPQELRSAKTLTAEYLSGRKRAEAPRAPQRPERLLEVLGAAEHNLKNLDAAIPLERLVCVTGVSGSGKSTLVQDVLYAALLKAKGRPTEAPGRHRELRGADAVGDVVMVDQSPIGKTTRSNPASYVGAFDAIRDLFAKAPVAKERKYTPGTFSFNSGNGRCPACGGNGFEHVEMQFLSDVYLRCPDCDGRRYRPEVLEVRVRGKSIADALEMTISEAVAFFKDEREILARLQPLADVGLDYLRLGQPVPTLSGGEAQRLKLAGHLAEGKSGSDPKRGRPGSDPSHKLFLFDEPTTGLHFEDIAKLLRAFRKLLAAGHSLVVIEHNLDVIRAADWILDLGPEGGDAGGELVCAGTPEEVMAHATSHTGRALREYEEQLASGVERARAPHATPHAARPAAASTAAAEPAGRYLGNVIRIHNAREHNLKNIDVDIPRQRFTVVTGVSGSGKSTLAFDILFSEGQRRYLESLNAYARQFVQVAARPDVDAIFGIPPTVAIEQRTSRGGRKSTVGTLTEIHHFLRLLFVKLGTQHCPDCDVPIEPQSEDAIAARLMKAHRGDTVVLLAPLVINRKGVYTDLAKWAAQKGYKQLRVDGKLLPLSPFPRLDRFKEHTIELPVGYVKVTPKNEKELRERLARALEHGKGVVHVQTGKHIQVYSTKRACPSCGRSFQELDPRLFSYNSRHGWCPTCVGTGLQLKDVGWDAERSRTGQEDHVLDSWIEWLEVDEACPDCEGRRLNPEALAVRWRGRSIADYGAEPVAHLAALLGHVKLEGRERDIARDLVAELKSRLGFLKEVGLDYLALDRSAPTLSGGEAQRIRLAAQLGSNLRGVCYILDEPTIGLHHRDNRILLDVLEKLEAKGNTLVVVEHDEDTIRRAHHVIDLGPGAGKLGGRVIAAGTAEELVQSPESVTGRFLANPLRHPLQPRRPVKGDAPAIEVAGASLHNLKNIGIRVPLGRLTAITGVSGSGKSTLARDVLHASLKAGGPIGCKSLKGAKLVERVLEVDQAPIGKTPRSCPATYVGFWDSIRRLFADTSEARIRGWGPSRFSFNTKGGRCETCEGQGIKKIEMSFLPDVKVACEACNGQRFDGETLTARLRGRSVGEVLAMSVDEAVEFFAAHPSIHHALRLLQDVGLGYLTLGQQSPTLSGGEAQRIKLVTELAKVRGIGVSKNLSSSTLGGRRETVLKGTGTLYVLDEPTVGLHMADVEKLIRVLHRLVDAGNSVVLIEHNLDVIAEADWLIDLGPEGGDAGGKVVYQGPPEKAARGHTAQALGEFLAQRKAA